MDICPEGKTFLPFRFPEAPLLWTAEQVLDATECQCLVDRIDRANPKRVAAYKGFRDVGRVMEDDAQLTALLFERLAPTLPARIGPFTLSGLNPLVRLYRYLPGQHFAPHMDHWYQADETHVSLLTVLVYLNDGFTGGETRFMEQLETTVTPKTGAVVIFQHKIRHEGCPVVTGTKFALRTDVMYAAPSPIFMGL